MLRYAVSGGEPLSASVANEFFDKFGVRISEGYGLTETSPVTNWCLPAEYRARSVGRALPRVEQWIVDAQGNRLGANQDGEIRMRGPNIMQGYWNLPAETAQVFDDKGFFRSGDMGRLDDDGHLYITGRIKEMLIIAGENVFPREIEDVLNHHPSVKASAVIGAADESRGETALAFVEINEGFAFDEAALRAHCREHMAQFTADASHELRTPLTVILSDSQGALRQERTPEEYRATLETIKQSALRMKSISDALLELAHGDAGRPVAQDACDLADLADESVALLGRVAREHGATLVSHLEGAPVVGDAGRLGRVILNLSINAILHNDNGVTVTVTTGVTDGCSELRVADDGRGIAPESIGGIFERFRRVDASRSRHTGGAGLGLAIVKQTVEAHGGTIAVTSEVGKGTVFVVRLPKA